MITKIIEGFSSHRIQIISGPRSVVADQIVVKLIDQLKLRLNVVESAVHRFDLNDILVKIAFEGDFSSFIKWFENVSAVRLGDLSQPVLFIFEQIQNARHLFPLIAQLKNIDAQHIHILLTSSIDLTNDSGYRTYLSPISEIHFVYPPTIREFVGMDFQAPSVLQSISQGEFNLSAFQEAWNDSHSHQRRILDIIQDYVTFGASYVGKHPASHDDRIRSNLRDYFERILNSVYQISDLKKMDHILRILAMNNGAILNLLKICEQYGLNRNTMRKYSGIFSESFIVDFVPPYIKGDVDKPIMRTPRMYFCDNGLVNYLNGIHDYHTLENSIHFQSNLDAMLLSNLRAVIPESVKDNRITFLRDYQNHELDFLISTEKGLIPIGICMNDDIRKLKIKTFRYYLRYCQGIYHGVIFTSHDRIECMDMKKSKLFLLPIYMLW